MPLGPSSVGPYSITRELGHGGMGVVYLARDTRLDRQVAIKALPAHLAADPDRLGRFEREAKVLASLSHPGIAAIYGLEEANSQRYLVLEFVEGESLAQRLERGPMPVDEALDVARQIALALEAAHEKGVIHRDLKPGNVMVTPEGVVKVLDFGLARTADGAPSFSGAHAPSPDSPTLTTPAARPAPVHSPTVPGVIMGTAGYMSPEQARGKPVDKRSDIFSFGCVLYEMLSGAGPFPGETVTDSLGAILHREPDWALLPPGTSTRVRDLLVRCLAKDRRNRLHDIADARIELERAIAGHDWGTAAGARGTRAGFPSVPVALVAAAALIAVGAGLWRALAPRAGPTAEPVCVAVPMPADARVEGADITPDGRTLVVRGKPRATDGAGAGQWRAYTRELGTFDFKPLAGSDDLYFMRPTRDSRGLIFVAPASPGSSEERCMLAPLDGGSPPTPIVDWKDEWADFLELASGDLLILDDASSLIRLTRATGALTPPMRLDAGRPGVVRFEFSGMALPGDRGALVNVVSYGSKGFQHSVGVLDFTTGRVKVIVEDGGNAALSPTGHLVFARGDVALAAPFDPEATEVRGSPVAVWGGLPSPYSSIPGWFRLTDGGALMYQPSPPGGWNETISVLSEGGKLEPWWSDLYLPKSIHPSPDGSRALLQLVNARNIDELWVSPVSHADLVKLSAEANADSFSGVWAPDGKRIAYTRIAKDDADGVYIQTVDGGEPRRVLKFASAEQPAFPTAWLPDGSTLLINVRDAGRWTIRRMALSDQEADAGALTPLLPSESNRIDGLLSRDGRLLAFASDESGKFQNWVVEMRPGGEPGRPVQIKTLGSRGHAWAPDGRTLYVQDERGRLMKLTVEVEPALSVSSPVEVADFERLGVRLWQPLAEGRFFVGLRHEGWSDIKHFNLALNWTETLKDRAKAK